MTTRTQSLPNAQNVTREVLPNGITVLVYENFTAQSVVLTGSVSVGSIFDPVGQDGLAALTADALMRGSQSYDFDTINESLESIGADLGISGSTFTTSVSGKALGEDLSVLLRILSDVLRHPTFPADEIERLRGEIVTGLNYREQDTRYRAGRAFYSALYPETHPYYASSDGTPETVGRLSIEDVRAFHAQHYGPREMILVIVGAITAEQAIALVRENFADWENPSQPVRQRPTDFALPKQTRRVNIAIPGKTQSDIVMGTLGPARLSPDFQAAQLVNSVLGQFGMMGRIGGKIREELGLAYYASSSVEGGITALPWRVAAGVDPANVDLAIDRIIVELRQIISEPVTADELSDNLSYFIGRMPLQLETNEGVASTIRNIETFGLGLDYLLTYPDMIRSLTPHDLLRAAQHYLNPDALVIAVAGR